MQHGGDIYRNSIRLDFSVNVNPLGIPERVKAVLRNALDYADHYPDHEQTLFRAAVASKHHVRSAQVIGGNGASELFMGIMHAIRPARCLIPVPSYVGYEYVTGAVGCETVYYERGSEFGLGPKFLSYLEEYGDDFDMLILACPNNPTGIMIRTETLREVMKICVDKGIYLLLDLSFLDLTDRSEEYEKFFLSEHNPYFIRVYGFTKTYAVPGLRLGYALASEPVRDIIARQLPEWNLSMLAQHAGVACLEDGEYLKKTREYIMKERPWLREELGKLGIETYDSESNFLLLSPDRPIFDILFHDRVLIRDCDNYRGLPAGHYRIAIRSHSDNMELIRVLKQHL